MSRSMSRTPKRRRGFSAMELLVTLPILMFLLFGLFEFAILFHARTLVAEASRVGARAATLRDCEPEKIADAVRETLPKSMQAGMELDYVLGERTGDKVLIGVRVSMADASPDLLWPVGFSLKGRDLYAETLMVKE